MIVYIAGPITGRLNYRKAFKDAEESLKEKGHIVINPSELPPGLNSHSDYMHVCIAMIDVCDTVYLLNGRDASKGAKMEYDYALDQGKMILNEGGSVN